LLQSNQRLLIFSGIFTQNNFQKEGGLMPNNKIPPPHRQKRRLGLIALAPIVTAMAFPVAQAAVSPITATAKYDTKIGKVVVSGKTATTILAGAKVSVLDASNNTILYTINTDKQNAFTMSLLGTTSVPCLVRVEVTNPKDNSQSQILLPVNGADKSCTTTAAIPACAITKPAGDTEITVGSSLAFNAAKVKGDYLWSINDGSDDFKQASVNHQFTAAGKYRVTLSVTNSAGECLDDVLVSVIPPKGTNPNGKVTERTAPTIGEAMPIEKNGKITNDIDALAVLPYEDMGMQGGSQISLPYNAMINYNALNAQVLKKVEHKPVLLDDTSVSLAYSAASNPKDPAGKRFH
jgi:hypothetical protein